MEVTTALATVVWNIMYNAHGCARMECGTDHGSASMEHGTNHSGACMEHCVDQGGTSMKHIHHVCTWTPRWC